jgi:DNA-binding response OmpR family regulator
VPQAQTARTTQIILVVEDEPALVDVIVYNLRQAGFETVEAGDGREALRLAAEVRPALVILDLMLPDLDGLAVCRTLRERFPALPIIMVTARTSELDRVLGLELGADDYVPKPFSPRELVARVRAVLRRADGEGRVAAAASPLGLVPATVPLGRGVTIDRRAREVLRLGLPVAITPTEFRLLELMVDHAGETLSRRQLFDLAWGQDAYGDERTVDVHIRHLREKLEVDPSRPELIVTVRGFGYRLVRLPDEGGRAG